jgi:hypothetical protein
LEQIVQPLSRKRFHLSAQHTTGDVSCSNDGVFVGDVPLLERSVPEGRAAQWRPRDLGDLNADLGKRYGLPVEFAPKIAALAAVAKTLNRNELVLAQIATLHLQIPDPPSLTKSVPSAADVIELAGRLHASGLLKADWDEPKHPRWPEGAPDSQGGRFAALDQSTGDATVPNTEQSSSTTRTPSDSAVPSGPPTAAGEPEFSQDEIRNVGMAARTAFRRLVEGRDDQEGRVEPISYTPGSLSPSLDPAGAKILREEI